MYDKKDFKWHWCSTCDDGYIKCPKCGNNTCNAGSGFMDRNGKIVKLKDLIVNDDGYCDISQYQRCDVCSQAHKISDTTNPPLWMTTRRIISYKILTFKIKYFKLVYMITRMF